VVFECIMIDRPSEWADGITDDLCSGFSLDKIASCSRRDRPLVLDSLLSIYYIVLAASG